MKIYMKDSSMKIYYENSMETQNEITDTNSYDTIHMRSPAGDTDISSNFNNRTNTADMAESDSQLEETEEIWMEKVWIKET